MQVTTVIKRDGNKEILMLDKIHRMVSYACRDISDVSPSQVELNANLQFTDGISTKDVQEILIKSAIDLISEETPNYQHVAARLMVAGLRKEVFGQFNPCSLLEITKTNVDAGVYDSVILDNFTEEDFATMESFIKHDRDFNFVACGIQQVINKYLVQDRSTGHIFETPQIAYMLISATLFANYDKDVRMQFIKQYYDDISLHHISLPTPIIAGVRTPTRQYSSCVLIDVADNIDSIYNSNTAVGKYTARRAGIGLNMGRIRALGSKIRNGEVAHTGQLPFLKMFAATVKSCTQNGLRGGSQNTNYQWWHKDIMSIVEFKNNKGSEDNRVRTVDYTVQMNKMVYSRAMQGKDVALFSPHEVEGLYDAFTSSNQYKFEELYLKYEKDLTIPRETINASDLLEHIVKERFETGRIYIMNIDNCNLYGSHSNVSMTNLCCEILLNTSPINHIDDEEGRIATCTLSAINVGRLNSNNLDEVERIAEMAVRGLDQVVGEQDYPVISAEIAGKRQRNLGVGVVGLAHYFAKNDVVYGSKESLKLTHELFEKIQYSLIKASVKLAKEKGCAQDFRICKYSDGSLPIDRYKSNVDTLGNFPLTQDWEELRSDVRKYGMRNCTLSALMPSESSSIVMNETNGIEPPRGALSIKTSKQGNLKQLVAGYPRLKNKYTYLWDMDGARDYLNVVAIMQKFVDQSISANTSYNPLQFEDNKIPLKILINDIIHAYSMGVRTLYYNNTYDMQDEDETTGVNENDDEQGTCEACTL